MTQAVITADIERSTALNPDEREALFTSLKDEINVLGSEGQVRDASFYRGDSFQLWVPDSRDALRAGMLLKTRINKLGRHKMMQKRGKKVIFDTAVAIGIGNVSGKKPLAEQNERPFILSGRGLEKLKSAQFTIGIFTGNDQTDHTLETILYVYEWIMRRWTLTSAELVYHKLKGKTERDIARELNVSQSAINQRSQAACWTGLERIIKRYRDLEEHNHD